MLISKWWQQGPLSPTGFVLSALAMQRRQCEIPGMIPQSSCHGSCEDSPGEGVFTMAIHRYLEVGVDVQF